MIYVKNISNKVIGIPVAEGGDSALLPDATMAVDDAYASQVKTLVGFGLVEECAATEVVDPAGSTEAVNDNAEAKSAEDEVATEVPTEKKTRGRRKATIEE